MRYVVVGAGAVGGTIGGRLSQAGHDVVVVARGEHLRTLQQRGLSLRDPDAAASISVPAVALGELSLRHDDVVVLAVKTQASAAVLDGLVTAGPDVPVVCAQNGVENERAALRRFSRVYGMCVMLPADHLEPGVVRAYSAPVSGILDVGPYPSGRDEVAERLAEDLEEASFSSRCQPDIMRWKYGKLLLNLGNAIEAACGLEGDGGELYRRARLEAEACYRAAGIDWAGDEEDRARRGELMRMRRVDGERRGGGSSWQSLARRSGSIETDYLNGEIVLLGRLRGVPTPCNALLQRVANEMARAGEPPQSRIAADLLATLPT